MKIAGSGLKAEQSLYIKIFGVGMLLGIIIMNFGKSILLENTGLFDEYTLYYMKNRTVDGDALFIFVLKERTQIILFLIIAATTYLGLLACRGVMLWYGISAGAFLTALVLRYGIKGMILAVVSVFPQYILYAPAILALVLWCEELFRGIYYRSGEFANSDKRNKIRKMGQLLTILFMVLVGCFLEGYVNSRLLIGFLQVF